MTSKEFQEFIIQKVNEDYAKREQQKVLEEIKIKIDEEIKKQEEIINTQQLTNKFLIAVNVKNTLEKIKEWLKKENKNMGMSKEMRMITDIRCLINEFYSTDEDKEGLLEEAKESRRIFNEYCVEIFNTLDEVEKLKDNIGELKIIVKQERDFIDMLIAEINKEKYDEWSKTHPIENLDKEIKEWLENDK